MSKLYYPEQFFNNLMNKVSLFLTKKNNTNSVLYLNSNFFIKKLLLPCCPILKSSRNHKRFISNTSNTTNDNNTTSADRQLNLFHRKPLTISANPTPDNQVNLFNHQSLSTSTSATNYYDDTTTAAENGEVKYTNDSLYETPSSLPYLQTLSFSEVLSLSLIGLVTINKYFLDFVLKLFPIIPNFLMKLLISPLYTGGSNFNDVISKAELLKKRGISNIMLSLTIENSPDSNISDFIIDQSIDSVTYILKPHMINQLNSNISKKLDINTIPPGYIAIKPSALTSSDVLKNFINPLYKADRERLIDNCSKIALEISEINKSLKLKYPERVAPFIILTIDAESYDLQKPGVYALQRELFKKFNTNNELNVIGTWQLYLQDSFSDLINEKALAKKYNYKLGMKLVRGAYLHSDSELTKHPIFPTKQLTDDNYNNIVTSFIKEMNNNSDSTLIGHMVIASHNYKSNIKALKLSNHSPNIVIGHLLGMADNITHDLINTHNAINVIKYVPWGPFNETKYYLKRRLQENGDAIRGDNGIRLLSDIFKLFTSKRTNN